MTAPLPIDPVLPALLDALRLRGSAVLVAPPGAGKTTRVPPAILDGGLARAEGGKDGRIILLEPRRVAARAAARRIAAERGGELGDEVQEQLVLLGCPPWHTLPRKADSAALTPATHLDISTRQRRIDFRPHRDVCRRSNHFDDIRFSRFWHVLDGNG